MNLNTFDRYVHYFHALCNEVFTYNGKQYKPFSKLILTPSVFESYTCPENCGACCKPVTLTWSEDEFNSLKLVLQDSSMFRHFLEHTTEEYLLINNKKLKFFVFNDISNKFCYFINKDNGRCLIYNNRIMPGRLELFKFAISEKNDKVYARVAKPGRGWAYKTIKETKGVLCTVHEPYKKDFVEGYISALFEVKNLMDYFNINNDCDKVITYLKSFSIATIRKNFIINRYKRLHFI